MALSKAGLGYHETEWRTRKQHIDPRLRAAGWRIVRHGPSRPIAGYTGHAVEEYPTADGPADYALFVDGRPLAIVEAKRVGLGPQSVLSQTERSALRPVGVWGTLEPRREEAVDRAPTRRPSCPHASPRRPICS